MKYIKMLGLAAVAAMALMAFAGPAAATVLTYPHGTEYTGNVVFSAEESLFLEASVIQITCTESTVEGTVSTNTTVASGAISTLSFSNCGSSTVDVLANGSMEVKPNGEVIAKGNRVTTEEFGISCVYGGGTTGTKISTITPTTTATTAKISAELPKQTGSSFLCPSKALWEGAYTLTQPEYLVVDD